MATAHGSNSLVVLQGEAPKMPQVLKATITSGTLHIVPWKLDIPLPIRWVVPTRGQQIARARL